MVYPTLDLAGSFLNSSLHMCTRFGISKHCRSACLLRDVKIMSLEGAKVAKVLPGLIFSPFRSFLTTDLQAAARPSRQQTANSSRSAARSIYYIVYATSRWECCTVE
jgi:hypothetical protein